MKQDRTTLMISGISYALILLILYFTRFSSTCLLYVSAILVFIALLYPYVFIPLNKIIHHAGRILIDFIVKIILISLFFLIFTPIVVVRRKFFGKNQTPVKFDKSKDSYFKDKEKIHYDKKFFERLY